MIKNNIKNLRIVNNFTQEKLAREINITLNSLQKIEAGKQICSIEIALKLKRVLKVNNIEELFQLID